MGCRILSGNGGACFYDSVTNTVFGVLLDSLSEAEAFEKHIGRDLRALTDKEFIEELDKFREDLE